MLQRALWSEALQAVQQAVGQVQGSEMKAIAGKLADAESMIALKVGIYVHSLPWSCGWPCQYGRVLFSWSCLAQAGPGSIWRWKSMHDTMLDDAHAQCSRPCSVLCAQDLMNRLGCGNLYHDGGFASHDADVRSNYIMNSSIAGADQADVILFVGTNPRVEAPVFNARHALLSGHLFWVCTGLQKLAQLECPCLPLQFGR